MRLRPVSLRAFPWTASLLLLSGLVAFTPPASAAGGDTCETAEVVPTTATRTGTVYRSWDPATNEDWYRHIAAGPASWTLTYSGADADLVVISDDCQTTLCYSATRYPSTVDSCSVPTGHYNFRVVVVSYNGDWMGPSTYTLTFSGQPPVACHDNVDNDGDGNVDYPADPGCSGPGDATEGPTCPPLQPGVVVCLQPGEFYTSLRVAGAGPGADVAGYVDLYRITVGDVVTTLPCVVLKSGSTAVDPCAAAGGVFVGRQSTLVEADLDATGPGVVSVCKAELTATVMGIGVDSAPAYALC